MQKNMFFFACPFCCAKLVNEVSEVGQKRSCTQCSGQLTIPKPPERIPPFAILNKVEQTVVSICPYCREVKRITSNLYGTRINCEQCHIPIEIPKIHAAKLQLKLSQNTITADGKGIVHITIRTIDRDNIAVAGQKVELTIERQRGKSHKVTTVTKENGQVTVGYTVNVYSGVTQIKAVLCEHTNTTCQLTLKEINGVADERIRISDIVFSPRNPEEDIKGEIVLENNNEIDIVLSSIAFDSQQNKNISWGQTFRDTKITAHSKYNVPFSIPHTEDNIQKMIGQVKVVAQLPNVRKTFVKDIEKTLPSTGKVYFILQSDCEEVIAGQSFSLKIKAMCSEKLATSFTKELDVSFCFDAKKSPNDKQVKFPEKYKLKFNDGIAQTENIFCSFASQPDAVIVMLHQEEVLGETANIKIIPSKDLQLNIQLTSPQINGEKLTGTNTIEVTDIYGNFIDDFNENITLSVENGYLNSKEEQTLLLPTVNGVLDLTSTGMSCIVDNVSQKANLQCAYQKIKSTDSWEMHSLECHMELSNMQLIDNCILEGEKGEVTLTALIEPSQFSLEKVKVLYGHFPDQVKEIDAPFIYNDNELSVSLLTEKLSLTGEMDLQLSLCAYNPITNEKHYADSDKISGFLVEKAGRTFAISSMENDVVVGQKFAISIQSKHKENVDTTYSGKKKISFFYNDIKENENLVSKVTLDFINGEACTDKILQFNEQRSVTIEIEDPSLGGAKGTFTCEILSGKLQCFDIHIDPQDASLEKNYILAKDAFGNTINNFAKDVILSSENLNFYNKGFSSILPGEQFVDGKCYLEKLFLFPDNNCDEESYICFSCDKVQTKHQINFPLQKGTLLCKSLVCDQFIVECGDKIDFDLHLYNNGHTSLKINKLSLTIGNCSIPLGQNQQIEGQQYFHHRYSCSLPENLKKGTFPCYVTVETTDLSSQETNSYSYKNRFSLQIEPKNRTLNFIMPTNVVAGKKFGIEIEVWHNGELDQTYNRKSILKIKGEHRHEEFPPTVPDNITLNFHKGSATTDTVFCLYASENRYTFDVSLPAPGRAESMLTFPECVAAEIDHLHVICAQKQVACRPFGGNFIVCAQDKFTNLKEDFSDKVTVEAIGSGSLQLNNAPFIIKPQQFKKGKVKIDVQNLCYRSTLRQTENVQILLRSSKCTSRFPMEITPAPAELSITGVTIPNKKVQWNESNYIVSLKIENIGQTTATVTNAEINFYFNDTKVEEGYEITAQKKATKIAPGDTGVVPLMVALSDKVPLGSHSLMAHLEYKDEYYKVESTCTTNNSAWQVEPCGRVVTFSTNDKPRMLEAFAFDFSVSLNGKVDTTYHGKRVYLCSSKNNITKKIPRKLDLTFYEGMAQSKTVFQFDEKAQNVEIEFLEMEVGGASGKGQITIYPERLEVVLQRYWTSLVRFCKEHKRRLILAFCALYFILFGFWHWQKVKETQSFKILSISGVVTVDGQKVNENSLVYQSQNVQVSPGGFCVLQTKNGSTVKLYKSANIYIQSVGRGMITSSYDNQIDVKKGEVSYQASETSQGQSFPKIAIPDADKVDVSSQKFRVGVQDEGSLLSVYQGSVGLTSGGQTISVGKNQGSSVKKGQVPSPPRSLPTPPTWISPDKDGLIIATNAIPLEWQGTTGINLYTLEVFNRDTPSIPLQSEDVEAETPKSIFHKLRGISNGSFYCQLTSIDSMGFASESIASKFFIRQVDKPKCELIINGQDKKSGRLIDIEMFFIDKIQYKNGSEIESGVHKIEIKKPGYHIEKMEITLDNDKDVKRLQVKLLPKERVVEFDLQADTGYYAKDTVSITTKQGQQIENPSKLNPDKYTFVIKVEGFKEFSEEIVIIPGEKPQKLAIPIIAKERQFSHKINTGIPNFDFNGVIKLGEHENPKTIKPGEYNLDIQCDGFERINKDINILPKEEPFVLEEKIMAMLRPIFFKIKKDKSDIPGAVITATQGQEEFKLKANVEQKLLPGNWNLLIEARGYRTEKKSIYVKPSQRLFEHEILLEIENVKLEINLFESESLQGLKLTIINSNEKRIDFDYQKIVMLPPGEYTLKVTARGYQDYTTQTHLRSDEENVEDIRLEPIPVKLNPQIIDPQHNIQETIVGVIHNGELNEELELVPGQYTATIQTSRFGDIQVEVNLSPGQSMYQIYTVLPYKTKTYAFTLNDILKNGNIVVRSKDESIIENTFLIDSQTYSIEVFEDGQQVNENQMTIVEYLNKAKVAKVKAFHSFKAFDFKIGCYRARVTRNQYIDSVTLSLLNINVKEFLEHIENEKDINTKIQRIETTLKLSEIVESISTEEKEFLSKFILTLEEESAKDLRYLIKALGENK
ncbi:hypothetical protein [Candidatus Uabimicrobium sp. HlEnr_7]|uniref:hypothetical protein n=1 Tax=Candidatus Uabimicrobium helgolandensis TaxID=3095367 RepID=UPI0035567A5A